VIRPAGRSRGRSIEADELADNRPAMCVSSAHSFRIGTKFWMDKEALRVIFRLFSDLSTAI
jgi:hypothetical protein